MTEQPATSATAVRRRMSIFEHIAAVFLTVVGVIILLPIILPVAVRGIWHDHRRMRRLRRSNRIMDWNRAWEGLLSGKGVLFVEVLPKGVGDIWFTDAADLLRHPECPLPTMKQEADRPVYERLFSEPVSEWCRDNMPEIRDRLSLVRGRRKAWEELKSHLPHPSVLAVWFSVTSD